MEAAIAEEKAKAVAKAPCVEISESLRNIPKRAEGRTAGATSVSESGDDRVKELEKENLDLQIINRGKDFFIEQLQKERTGFYDQLLAANRKVGELAETRPAQTDLNL